MAETMDLSILSLSQPFLNSSSPSKTTHANRDSNASNASSTTATNPALLAADLSHYQDLFTKLRFSYVEQVTKERFLRALVANPPEFTDARDNAELAESLKAEKAVLKSKKEEVRMLVEEMERQGRGLAGRYEALQLQTTQLSALPIEIESLQTTISDLRAQQQAQSLHPHSSSSNPDLALPLQPTLDLLATREEELADLDAQIELLRRGMPEQERRVQGLRDELAPLQVRKIAAVREAQDAMKRRGEGGGREADEKGRWLRGVETTLRAMVEG